MHTKDTLKQDLKNMGLMPDATVLIHSSMKSIGEVAGRASGVLAALTEYFSDGLIIFPTLTWNCVNDESPDFSALHTASCTGILPELFRKLPGTERSLHPTHSVTALGRDAADFVAGHENFDSPAHRNSPWGRLYDRHAIILFIGVDLSCNTFLHSVEEWLPVPGMLTGKLQMLSVTGKDGITISRPSRRHVGGHSRYYHLMEEEFLVGGALHEGIFGDARTRILDARKAGDITFAKLQKNPLFFTEEFQNQTAR